jgi:hypothetical protein
MSYAHPHPVYALIEDGYEPPAALQREAFHLSKAIDQFLEPIISAGRRFTEAEFAWFEQRLGEFLFLCDDAAAAMLEEVKERASKFERLPVPPAEEAGPSLAPVAAPLVPSLFMSGGRLHARW